MAALILGLSIWLVPRPARAAPAAPSFTVNSTIDAPDTHPGDGACDVGGGVCTLRAAIMEANHTPGGGATVQFGLAGVVNYTLRLAPVGEDDESTGDLNITNTTTIIGRGAANTIIDGNQLDEVFSVGSLFHPSGPLTATISAVTIENGRPGWLNPSGGLSNYQTLVLSDSIVRGNAGSIGGGLYNGNTLTLSNSTITGNTAVGNGGGVFDDSGSTTTVNNSTISGNTGGSGGGVFNDLSSALTLSASTLSGNTAGGNGGGLANNNAATVSRSTLSGNTADGEGGGLWNKLALTIVNSTVSGNNSNLDGGGLYNAAFATTSLFNATVTGNTANADARGIGVGGGAANAGFAFSFQNSVIAGNDNVVVISGSPLLNPEDCSGTLTSGGDNIVLSTADCVINGGFVVADPLVDPLANNGGPTQTHALRADSPAIDTGSTLGCKDLVGAQLTADQRGFARPVGGRCDIGAFEYDPPGPFLPLIQR